MPTPSSHFPTPLDNMIAAASRLAAIPMEGDSPVAVETRRARDLLQTTMVQQQAYSYCRYIIHSTPRPSRSYSGHVEEPTVSSSGRNHNPPRRPNPAGGRNEAQDLVDQGRARLGASLTAQDMERQLTPVCATAAVEPGVAFTTLGVPCLTPALRNARLPKDFKGPRKVPNYTAHLHPESWVESYDMAMEMLDMDGAVCAKYFTMMLEGTAHTWLKSLPPNSIRSWVELKSQFISNFKDTCKQPMSIVDLAACVQGENESTTHWVRRVTEILHSSHRINVDSTIITWDI